MLSWFRKLFANPAGDELALRAEIGRLQLALAEAEARRTRLEAEAARLQRQIEQAERQAIEAQMAARLAELAGPAAQFLTQVYLLDAQGREPAGRDVLAVARSLLRTLQNQGLEVAAAAGEQAAFDPDWHEPLAADAALRPGQAVLVRTPALAYQGRALRKAGVAALEEKAP